MLVLSLLSPCVCLNRPHTPPQVTSHSVTPAMAFLLTHGLTDFRSPWNPAVAQMCQRSDLHTHDALQERRPLFLREPLWGVRPRLWGVRPRPSAYGAPPRASPANPKQRQSNGNEA